MNNFIGFAGVGSAIIASMGLAMWLEWFCLRWLMRVMPGKMGIPQPGVAAVSTSEEIEPAASATKQAEPEMRVAPQAGASRYEIRLGI
jgi:hypothetical protein